MKNQNDLILQIVAGVLAVGCAVAFYFTKPTVTAPAPPTQVKTAAPTLPAGDVTFANALPGGGGTGAAGGFGGPRGMGGGGGRPQGGMTLGPMTGPVRSSVGG